MKERDKRIVDNDRLATYIAQQYYGLAEMDDLVSEARVGLIEASDSYDPGRGIPFASWAGIHIKKNIRRFLSDHWHIVRTPPLYIQSAKKISKIESDLLHQDGFIDDRKVASRINKSDRFVKVVMNTPINNTRTEYSDMLPYPDAPGDVQLTENLYNSILKVMNKVLNNREYMCVVLRHVGGLSYEDIVRCTNMSKTTISSTLACAMPKIRAYQNRIKKYG